MGNPYFSGWARGFIKVTPNSVWGCHLWSKKWADYVCKRYFGCGWRMADFHDGRWRYGMTSNYETYLAPSGDGDYSMAYTGGWNFWAYGHISHHWPHKYKNFWVAHAHGNANCWNRIFF